MPFSCATFSSLAFYNLIRSSSGLLVQFFHGQVKEKNIDTVVPSPPSAPPITVITLVDVVNSNREARVRAKHRKRAIQHTPPTAPPPSSFKPCAHPPASPVSIKPHCGPSVETSSLGSRSGAENPRIGTAPLPSPTAQGQATSGNVGPFFISTSYKVPHHPPSSSLVSFP
uniref:Uncharacterized protein n=1 Tax=Populus alba TaxID=43335 RepID=A0A4U5NQZ7_POPAL|nr:hypothetical protein D5086_0000248650 [Populus alba]